MKKYKILYKQWTETLVLEEADRVEKQGPAPPPEKSTAKKPDKRTKKGDKTQKDDSMYIFIKGGTEILCRHKALTKILWIYSQIYSFCMKLPYRYSLQLYTVGGVL